MADIRKSETIPLASELDVVLCRRKVRELANEIRLSLVNQTKIVTAASEIARNALVHGGGGEATLSLVESGARRGVRLEVIDAGPGIPDLDRALTDGFTTGSGLGLGLGGAKRLVDEFEVQSRDGGGTRVILLAWK